MLRIISFVIVIMQIIFYEISLKQIKNKNPKGTIYGYIGMFFGIASVISQHLTIEYYKKTIGGYFAGGDSISYNGDFGDAIALYFYIAIFIILAAGYLILKKQKKSH